MSTSTYADRITLGSLVLSMLDYRRKQQNWVPNPRGGFTVYLDHVATLLSALGTGQGQNGVAVSGVLHPHPRGASVVILTGRKTEEGQELDKTQWRRYQRNERETGTEILKEWHSRSLNNYIPDMITLLTADNPTDRNEAADYIRQTTCYALRYNADRIRHLVAIGHRVWRQRSTNGLTTTGPAQIIYKWVTDNRNTLLGLPYTFNLRDQAHARKWLADYDTSLVRGNELCVTKDNVDKVAQIFIESDKRVKGLRDHRANADPSITKIVFEDLYLHALRLHFMITTGVMQQILDANPDLDRVLAEAKMKLSPPGKEQTAIGRSDLEDDRHTDSDEDDEETASIRSQGTDKVPPFFLPLVPVIDPDVQLGQLEHQVIQHYNSLRACFVAAVYLKQHPIKALDLTEVQCPAPPRFVLEDKRGLREEFEQNIYQKLENDSKYRKNAECLARLKNTLGEKLDEVFGSKHSSTVSYHTEASLMAFANEYNATQGSDLVRDPKTSQLLSEVFGNSAQTIPIGTPKQCCYLCWRLSRLLKPGPGDDRHFDLPVHKIHGGVHPWAPPKQVPEDVLRELWEDICDQLFTALEAHGHEAFGMPLGGEDTSINDDEIDRLAELWISKLTPAY
ncbi:hypothetical protein V5O48_015050 [Marasmius crinis-equi]|uniref:Uncharacterized protein n=1 Tax=Marasmius crinis-equi TaxID=585013 RepID=A0ABR3EVL0_9AGAR